MEPHFEELEQEAALLVRLVQVVQVLAVQVERMDMLVALPTLLAAVVVLMLVVVAVLVVSVKQCPILLTLEQQQVDLEHQRDLDMMRT